MSNSWQALDGNERGTLTAVSSLDNTTIVRLVADPITGRLLVDASGGATLTFTQEIPAGLINGINTTYTLTNTPATYSLILSVARQLQILGVDYTLAGSTITFLTPLDSSLSAGPFIAQYAVAGGSLTGAVNVETPGGLVNGSNKVYTTVNSISLVVGLYMNGEFVDPSAYTVSGAGFTMGTAFSADFSGLSFRIVYI